MSLRLAIFFSSQSKDLEFRRDPQVRFCLLLPRECLSKAVCAVSSQLWMLSRSLVYGCSAVQSLSSAPSSVNVHEQFHECLVLLQLVLAKHCFQHQRDGLVGGPRLGVVWQPLFSSWCAVKALQTEPL